MNTMGTSKAYRGRPDVGRLLPPEAQQPSDASPQAQEPSDGNVSSQEIPQPGITFQQARRAFNQIVSGLRAGSTVGTAGGVARAARDYVRASGGARTAALAGPSGRAAARGLGGFLGAVARDGFDAAAARFNVQSLAGLPPDVILGRLLDALLPSAATRDAVLARSCLANALERWLQQHDVAGRGVEALEQTSSAEIPELMQLYLTEYVHDRMLNEIVNWAERTGDDETAKAISEELREYISGKLDRHIAELSATLGPDAWLDQADTVADRLFGEVFGLLEDLPNESSISDEEGRDE